MTFCGICGAPGHRAKDCALKELEMRRDPVGEQQQVREHKNRKRERIARRQQPTNILQCGQSSKGFGL